MTCFREIVAVGIFGVLSHWCIFIKGEYHLLAPIIVRVYLALSIALLFIQLKIFNRQFYDACLATVLLLATYGGSLFSSIIIYRTFFHRLRKFPGPGLASVTKFYHMWKVQDNKQYLFLETLHHQYGDFVRTGPSEVTIYSPDAISQVLGPASKCTKSLWWEMMWPEVSMITTRSESSHTLRRRAWDMGFSVKALRDHELQVRHYAEQLEAMIANLSGKPIDVTKYFEYYTFDLMGTINFGINFDMLKSGKPHSAVEVFKKGMTLMGPFTPVPWLFHVAVSIPGLQKDWQTFRNWAQQKLQSRLEEQGKISDSMSYVISHAQGQDKVERGNWLLSDFICLLSAASEPVLCTLIFLFYHLADAPQEAEKLRAELADLENLTDNRILQTLPHLNSLINETLRLHPPVPSAGLRDTPPEGLKIGSTYIPGNITILIPQYSLGRREDCYQQPNDFIPERWYSRPQMIRNKTAFIPFNTGNHGCIGQNLGLMEIRLLTALLVSKYNISFAPGEAGTKVFDDMVDLFVATPGSLKLAFQKRKGD